MECVGKCVRVGIDGGRCGERCGEVLGEVWKRALGCGGGKGRCGEKRREVCWGLGEISGDGRAWGSVEKCVGVYGR